MSDERTPHVGEIWRTAGGITAAAVRRADGWHWTNGERCTNQERRPLDLLGYSVEYVDNLRSDRRPQDVLREAALIVTTHGRGYSAWDCEALADDLDREDAEEADRDRMIEAAARVMLGEEAAALYDAGMLREAVTGDE